MQTFLPYPDFAASAQVLDYRRLNKQRIETFQLLNAIRGVDKNGEPTEKRGWVNHPAAVMWRQYLPALALYGCVMCEEWKRRGYNDNVDLHTKIGNIWIAERNKTLSGVTEMPYWFGREELHISHQSNLLRKDGEYYGEKFVGVPDDLPYVWYSEFDPDLTNVIAASMVTP